MQNVDTVFKNDYINITFKYIIMNWITKISDFINNTFSKARVPLSPLPSILLLCEVGMRPGLSAISLAASIIKRLPEYGINIGTEIDGSPNVLCGVVSIIAQELINEIHNFGVVEGVLQPGSIISTGIAPASPTPTAVTVTNVIPSSLRAIMR